MKCPHVPHIKTVPVRHGSGIFRIVVPYECPICGVEVTYGIRHPEVFDEQQITRILKYTTAAVNQQLLYGSRESSVLDLCVAGILNVDDTMKLLGVSSSKLQELMARS